MSEDSKIKARLVALERVAEAARGYVQFLPKSSAKEGGAARFSGMLVGSDAIRDALSALDALPKEGKP